MLKPNWSIQSEIQKRAQKESEVEWATSNTDPKLPKYEKPRHQKFVAVLYNFIKTNVLELKP